MSGAVSRGRQASQWQDAAAAGQAGKTAGCPLTVPVASRCAEIGNAAACILLAVVVRRDERDSRSLGSAP